VPFGEAEPVFICGYDKEEQMKKFSEFSFDEKRRMICDAITDLRKKAEPGKLESYPWVRDMYDDRVIVEDGKSLFEYPYTIAADGAVTLGDPKQVKVAYEAFAELKGVEILQTGTHVSAAGDKVTYTEADLDEIIKNAEELKDVVKPPLVVGHAEGDLGELINAQTVGAPQVGFVAPANLGKKKNEDGSFTLFGDILDIAAKAVDKIGTELKRVSPEIYNNFKFGDKAYGKVLRRVSFVPIPSIKTMADVTQAHLAYGEKPDQPTTWVIFSEENPESKGKENSDMDAAKLQERIIVLETENKTLKADKESATTKLSEVALKQKKDEIHRFCEGLKSDPKGARITPAMQEFGLEQFMESLDDTKVSKFGEAKDGKQAELSQLGFIKEFLGKFGPIIRFGEMAETGQGGSSEKFAESPLVVDAKARAEAAKK
jgi:hypothetical protein